MKPNTDRPVNPIVQDMGVSSVFIKEIDREYFLKGARFFFEILFLFSIYSIDPAQRKMVHTSTAVSTVGDPSGRTGLFKGSAT